MLSIMKLSYLSTRLSLQRVLQSVFFFTIVASAIPQCKVMSTATNHIIFSPYSITSIGHIYVV